MTEHSPIAEVKEHDPYVEPTRRVTSMVYEYHIGDIVELRNPKGILGVIKYIGPKRNMNGSLISEDTHYVIQLEEYVGNGNGSWHGYQYTNTLRPDHTMHLCKLNNIRCKRSGDDVLKALYNILRVYNKYKTQNKRQQSYINELENMNYKLEQRLQSQSYYHKELIHPNIAHNPMQFESKHIPLVSANTSSLALPIPPSTSNINLNQPTPHPMEFGGQAPSKSSLIPHSATALKTCTTQSIDQIMGPLEDTTQNFTSVRSSEIDHETEKNSAFSRSEKWVPLNANNATKDNRITPPPSNMETSHKTRRTHRRNQSHDYAQNNSEGNALRYHRHPSATFVMDGAGNMSQITELTGDECEVHNNNNAHNEEITPAPVVMDDSEIGESNMESVNVMQKRKDIESGGNAGKLKLSREELNRKESIEKVKNAKIVNDKVTVFERMIKQQSAAELATGTKRKKQASKQNGEDNMEQTNAFDPST